MLPNNRSAIRKGLLSRLNVLRRLHTHVTRNVPILNAYTNLVLLTRSLTTRSSGNAPHLTAVSMLIRHGTCNERLNDFQAGKRMTNVSNRIPLAFVHTPHVIRIRNSTGTLTGISKHVITTHRNDRLNMAFRPRLSRSAQLRRLFLRV